MMSSVIPARLLFQCGHAALVTLPRVKGETASQRNDRVAREKSAALDRRCDFCAPTVQLVPGASFEPTDAVADDPIESLAVVVSAEPEPEPVVETPSVTRQEDLPAVAEELPSLNGHVHVEEVDSPPPADTIDTSEPELESVSESAADVATESQPEPRRRPRAARTVRKPRAARPAAAAPRGYTFLVEYQLERVLRAADIHAVLRQVNALGAAQVTAITRED